MERGKEGETVASHGGHSIKAGIDGMQDRVEHSVFAFKDSGIHLGIEHDRGQAAAADVALEEQSGQDAVETGDEGIGKEAARAAGRLRLSASSAGAAWGELIRRITDSSRLIELSSDAA